MRLSKKKVEKIKAAIAAGTTQPEIAKKFKVSRSAGVGHRHGPRA